MFNRCGVLPWLNASSHSLLVSEWYPCWQASTDFVIMSPGIWLILFSNFKASPFSNFFSFVLFFWVLLVFGRCSYTVGGVLPYHGMSLFDNDKIANRVRILSNILFFHFMNSAVKIKRKTIKSKNDLQSTPCVYGWAVK